MEKKYQETLDYLHEEAGKASPHSQHETNLLTLIDVFEELINENQELKQDVKDVLEDYKDAALRMFKYAEVIEILKKLKINIYEGWGTWCIKIDDWSEIEEEQATLLKEVLENVD